MSEGSGEPYYVVLFRSDHCDKAWKCAFAGESLEESTAMVDELKKDSFIVRHIESEII